MLLILEFIVDFQAHTKYILCPFISGQNLKREVLNELMINNMNMSCM